MNSTDTMARDRRRRSVGRATTLAAAVTAALLALAACGSATAGSAGAGSTGSGNGSAAGATFPVKIVTASGTVKIAKRPASIMSLSPSTTEMLYAIGAGAQVKTVDQYSDYPAGTPMTTLSALTPNVEAIVARKPDLVIVPQDTGGLASKLAAFSIPVLVLAAPATIDGALAQYDQLGLATGHLAQAQGETASLRRQLAAIEASVPAHAQPVSYYYELDTTYYSVTSQTFIGNLLGLLGMKSVADTATGAAASGGYPQLSAEFIVKASPAYIILADSLCCHQNATTVAARPGWNKLAAVTSGHVVIVNDDVASRWGPRIITLLKTVLASLRGRG